jgi:protein ImuB
VSRSRYTLWAGLYCPRLPLAAVWTLTPDAGPVAVHDQLRGQARIVQASRTARHGGVQPGQSLTQALAVLPQLQSRRRDHRAEAAALECMALAAYGESHQVVLAPPATVVLEVGGSRRLRGGVTPLLERLATRLGQQGFATRTGVAPNAAAARLLARCDRQARTPEVLKRTLVELPLERLELPHDRIQALTGCGLAHVGELLERPAAERARRFGRAVNDYLEQILGRRDTPLANWQPPERFSLRLELPMATTSSEALLFVFRRALVQLEQWLSVRDRALTRLYFKLEHEEDAGPVHASVALARPGFDAERLLDLIRLKLDRIRLRAPVAAVTLRVDSTAENRPPQADLFSGHNRGDAWPALLDRLSARLGDDGLASLAPCPDHRPEKAWAWVAPGTTRPGQDARPRPSWLLADPRPCQRARLRLEDGPERIEAGWWDGQDCRRDYWIARDPAGRKLWVFREYKPRDGWFIHGVFG